MKNKTTNLKVMTLLGAISCSHLAMAEQIFQHQGQPPQLIELYTSEGCSSCPPADKYLATFLKHPQLWKAVVPLAFHVDYWDYLGWADPFAQQQFKERQYNYRRHNHISSVYTPGWIINGKEWRGFFSRQDLPANATSKHGTLYAQLQGNQLNVRYQETGENLSLTAHIAVLGFDLSSQIPAGENKGKTLNHAFVVLHKQEKKQDTLEWHFALPERATGQRYALAIWVSDKNQTPIQLAADWLKET